MKLTARKMAFHVVVLILFLIVASALAIWLGIGPVVHSLGADGRIVS